MELKENQKKEIERLMANLSCHKEFKCVKLGFESLCRVKYKWDKDTILCLEEDPYRCKLSLSTIEGVYCGCPIRKYFAKKIGF